MTCPVAREPNGSSGPGKAIASGKLPGIGDKAAPLYEGTTQASLELNQPTISRYSATVPPPP